MLKDLTTEQIVKTLKLGREVGFKHVKFYYIIGLEEEDESDYAEFFDFLETVVDMGYQEVVISVNPLVPKPFTPFADRKMVEKREYEEKTKFIRRNLPKKVKADFESYKLSRIQYELSNLKGPQTVVYLRQIIKTEK